MNYEISIIMPIYNSSKYLNDSLNSLINQSIFEKIEVILVNDGSTDSSKSICEKFASKYNNIKLINQSNQGVSAARNKGIINASGKYIGFIDSDDIIEYDLYEKEYIAITSDNYDILVVDFYKIHCDKKRIKYRKNIKKQLNNNNDIMISFFKGIIDGQVVDKLFSKNIINDISFPVDKKVGEDMWFSYLALSKSKRILIDTSICGYHYIVRESSAMTGHFDGKYFDSMYLSKKMFDDYDYDNVLKKYAKAHYIHESCKALEYIYRHNADNTFNKKVIEIRKIITNYSILNAKKYLIKKQFIGFILMRFSPRLYIYVHKIMHIG